MDNSKNLSEGLFGGKPITPQDILNINIATQVTSSSQLAQAENTFKNFREFGADGGIDDALEKLQQALSPFQVQPDYAICTPNPSPNKRTCTTPYPQLFRNTREEVNYLSQLVSDGMPDFLKQLTKTPGLNLDQYTAEDFTELEAQLSILPLPNLNGKNQTWDMDDHIVEQSGKKVNSSEDLRQFHTAKTMLRSNMDELSDGMSHKTNGQSAQQCSKQDLRNVLAMELDQNASVKATQDGRLSLFEHPQMMSGIQSSSNGQMQTAPLNAPYNVTHRGRSWTLPSGFRQPDIAATGKLSDQDLIATGQEYMTLLYGLGQTHPEEHTRRLRNLKQLLGDETVRWLKSKGVESQHIFEADRTNWIDVYNVPSGMQHPPPPFSSKEEAEEFDLIERGYDNINDELTKEQESQEVLICEDTAALIFGPNAFGFEKEVQPELWNLDDTFAKGIPCVLDADFESLIDRFYGPVPIETFDDSEAMVLDTSDILEAPLINENCDFPPEKRSYMKTQKEVTSQKLDVDEVVEKPTMPENRTRFRLKTSAPTSSAEWSWGEPLAKRTRAPSQTPKPQANTFSDMLRRAKKGTQSTKQPTKGKSVSAPLKSTYKAAEVEDDDESGIQASNLRATWEESANRGAAAIQSYPSQESLRHRSSQYRHIPTGSLSPGAPDHNIALSSPFMNSQTGFERSIAGGILESTYDLQANFHGSMHAQPFRGNQYQYGYQPHQQWNAGNTMQLSGSLPNRNPTVQVPANFNAGYSIKIPPNSSHSRDNPSTKHKNHNRKFSGGSGANAEPIQPQKQRKPRPEPLKFATVVPDSVLGDGSPVSDLAGISNSFSPPHSTNIHRQQNVQQGPEHSNSIPTYHRTSSASPDKKRGVRRGRGSPKKSNSGPPGTPSKTWLVTTGGGADDLNNTPMKLHLGQNSTPGKAGPREFAVISFTDIPARIAGEESLENKIKKDPLYMKFKVVADLGLKTTDLKVSGPPGSNVRGQLRNLFPRHRIDVAMA